MLSDDVWPVSVNDHVIESPGFWRERVSARHVEAAPNLVETVDGGQAWRIGPELLKLEQMLPSKMYRADVSRPVRRFEDISSAAWSPAARLTAMDRDRVAVHTLMPHIFCGFAGERLAKLSDTKVWGACVSAWNDFLFGEFCAAAPDRLVGVALLPLADPDAMVAEIERVAPMGARGISLPHNPALFGVDSYHCDSWQRVLDAADAAQLPMFIHIASSGQGWPTPGESLWRPAEAQVTLANLDVIQTACDLSFSPLLVERPKRRVVLLEANVSWLPYIEERLDFATRGRKELAPTGRPASRVMHEQIFASFLTDPVGIEDRHRIGLERILWQSDYPHVDSLWPDSRKELAALLSGIPDEEARQIAEGNARKLLRLPPNK